MGQYLRMCLSEKIYGRTRSNYSCFATEWQIDGMCGVPAGLPTAQSEKVIYKNATIENLDFSDQTKTYARMHVTCSFIPNNIY
jgi:hypothetical protein